METGILLFSLFIIVAFSSTVQTMSPPMMLDKLQHQEGKSQRAMEESASNQQRKILGFLSAFDDIQKSTKPRLDPKTTGLQAYAKKFGKTIRKDILDEPQASRSFSQQDDVAESRKDHLRKSPLIGKNFRKAAPSSSKKAKKRACFWKYCVQSK
ncbi:uncharacterized protein LOC144327511 isoform X1 [Podarcis muralis]